MSRMRLRRQRGNDHTESPVVIEDDSYDGSSTEPADDVHSHHHENNTKKQRKMSAHEQIATRALLTLGSVAHLNYPSLRNNRPLAEEEPVVIVRAPACERNQHRPRSFSDVSRITDDEASLCTGTSPREPIGFPTIKSPRVLSIPMTSRPPLPIPTSHSLSTKDKLQDFLGIPPLSAKKGGDLPNGRPLAGPPRLYTENFKKIQPIRLKL